MPKFAFDSSYVITHKLSDFPDNFYYSDVVLLEFMGSADDQTTFKYFEALREASKADETLITPTLEDWLMASKILFWIEQGVKKRHRGIRPSKQPGATQRKAFDALIAVSARHYGVTVITENVDDFKLMKYYCNSIKYISGSDYNAKYGKP